MGNPDFRRGVGFIGLILLLLGGALFQFYALQAFGEVATTTAAGAGLICLGGLMVLASRSSPQER